jgi:hypothetical protein
MGLAQKTSELDSITFDQMKELLNSKNYPNRVALKNYKTKTGSWISIGDTLEIGPPSNPNSIETGVVQGANYTTHSYIILGTGAAMLTGTVMMGNQAMIGDRAFVTEIEMGRMSKKQDYSVFVSINRLGGGRFLNIKKLARVYIDNALESGEVIDPNAPMNRQQAIAKLKEAKELLDIGMMKEEDFEKLKKELEPIIMNN